MTAAKEIGRVRIYEEYPDGILEKWIKVHKRRGPLATEHYPPEGQAALWYADVIRCVPLSGQRVAKQIARLAKGDSQVTIPWRSLADAVGVKNRAGNLVSYTERGVKVLVDCGWLSVHVEGRGRAAKTTFHLEVGEFIDRTWMDPEDFLDEEEM